ncbi:putative major facilitator superfamily transporter [Pseudomonas aeruginosa]|nr:putative major facilitator superfamily transporter [Pseudomonas aeruginosa]
MRSPTRPPAAADPASRRSVFAVVLGNAVEFFDFGVYATFAVMIGRTFFPSDSAFVSLLLSVTAFGVGFIIRPLGAILIGAYADRAGRKPAMLLTLFLMALGTGGIAVLPGYDSIGPAAPLLLVLTRLLQGLAWGGEAGPATTYILEAAPPHKRGTYACWQVVAQGIAAVAAGLMGYLLTLWLDERQLQEWGWRIPFAAGLLVLPIGLYIRLNLAETFAGRGRQASTRSLLGELFGNHRRALLLGLLILSGSTITQYFLNYMTTFALTELHLPAGIAMLSTLVAGAALALSALLRRRALRPLRAPRRADPAAPGAARGAVPGTAGNDPSPRAGSLPRRPRPALGPAWHERRGADRAAGRKLPPGAALHRFFPWSMRPASPRSAAPRRSW